VLMVQQPNIILHSLNRASISFTAATGDPINSRSGRHLPADMPEGKISIDISHIHTSGCVFSLPLLHQEPG
jgi:hypothetical protein